MKALSTDERVKAIDYWTGRERYGKELLASGELSERMIAIVKRRLQRIDIRIDELLDNRGWI